MKPLSLSLLALLTLALTWPPSAAAVDPDPRITVLSPADNTVVHPGDTVRLRLAIDPSVTPAEINIDSRLFSADLTAPPWEVDMPIPVDTEHTGPFEWSATVETTTGELLFGPDLNLIVIPQEMPSAIEVEHYFSLSPPKPDGSYAEFEGRWIRVTGLYANDLRRNLTASLLGTTYASSDPSVMTVTPEGIINPVAPGIAFAIVEYRGLKDFAEVEIEAPGGELPPIEHSAFSFTAGGFRVDRSSGFYHQEVTVTNTGSLPLAKPLKLVLSGLPSSIDINNSPRGITKTVAPLGTPHVSVPVEADFLRPGDSATLVLEFNNRTGIPITYTPRLFTAFTP